MTDIVVPTLGESVTEATVAKWLKKPGDAVKKDETLVELETDKVSVEVSAPEAGTLSDIVAAEGATVGIGALLGRLGAGAAKAAPAPAAKAAAPQPAPAKPAPAPAAASAAPPSVQRIAAWNSGERMTCRYSSWNGRCTPMVSKARFIMPRAGSASARINAC